MTGGPMIPHPLNAVAKISPARLRRIRDCCNGVTEWGQKAVIARRWLLGLCVLGVSSDPWRFLPGWRFLSPVQSPQEREKLSGLTEEAGGDSRRLWPKPGRGRRSWRGSRGKLGVADLAGDDENDYG